MRGSRGSKQVRPQLGESKSRAGTCAACGPESRLRSREGSAEFFGGAEAQGEWPKPGPSGQLLPIRADPGTGWGHSLGCSGPWVGPQGPAGEGAGQLPTLGGPALKLYGCAQEVGERVCKGSSAGDWASALVDRVGNWSCIRRSVWPSPSCLCSLERPSLPLFSETLVSLVTRAGVLQSGPHSGLWPVEVPGLLVALPAGPWVTWAETGFLPWTISHFFLAITEGHLSTPQAPLVPASRDDFCLN